MHDEEDGQLTNTTVSFKTEEESLVCISKNYKHFQWQIPSYIFLKNTSAFKSLLTQFSVYC